MAKFTYSKSLEPARRAIGNAVRNAVAHTRKMQFRPVDTTAHDLHNLIDHNIDPVKTQHFKITSAPIKGQKAPVETRLTLTENGAYIVVSGPVPDTKNKNKLTPAITVLHAKDPDILEQLFLSTHDPKVAPPSPEEIARNVRAIKSRFIRRLNMKSDGQTFPATNWTLHEITNHIQKSREFLQNHGIAIKETGEFPRSDSSAYWAYKSGKKDRDGNDLYYQFLYTDLDHKHGKILLDQKSLDNWFKRQYFKWASVKVRDSVTRAPLLFTKREIYACTNIEFPETVRDTEDGVDPYDRFAVPYKNQPIRDVARWLRNYIYKITVRGTQNLINKISTPVGRTIFAVTAIAGIGMAATFTLFSAILPFLVVTGANFAARAKLPAIIGSALKSTARGARRLFSQSSFAQDLEHDRDITKSLKAQDGRKVTRHTGLGFSLNPIYVYSMRPVPLSQLTQDDLPEYTAQTRKAWSIETASHILSRRGGTIVSQVKFRDQNYLLARGPDGVDSFFHPINATIFLRRVRNKAHKCIRIPGALAEELNQAEEIKHQILGIRSLANSNTFHTTSFATSDDIPETFQGRRMMSTEETLDVYGTSIQEWQSNVKLSTDRILGIKAARKERRQRNRKISINLAREWLRGNLPNTAKPKSELQQDEYYKKIESITTLAEGKHIHSIPKPIALHELKFTP